MVELQKTKGKPFVAADSLVDEKDALAMPHFTGETLTAQEMHIPAAMLGKVGPPSDTCTVHAQLATIIFEILVPPPSLSAMPPRATQTNSRAPSRTRQVSLVAISFKQFGFVQLPSWVDPFVAHASQEPEPDGPRRGKKRRRAQIQRQVGR